MTSVSNFVRSSKSLKRHQYDIIPNPRSTTPQPSTVNKASQRKPIYTRRKSSTPKRTDRTLKYPKPQHQCRLESPQSVRQGDENSTFDRHEKIQEKDSTYERLQEMEAKYRQLEQENREIKQELHEAKADLEIMSTKITQESQLHSRISSVNSRPASVLKYDQSYNDTSPLIHRSGTPDTSLLDFNPNRRGLLNEFRSAQSKVESIFQKHLDNKPLKVMTSIGNISINPDVKRFGRSVINI